MRIVATDTIVSRLTFETLLPVFPTGESARQGAGLTLGMRAQFTMRKEGLLSRARTACTGQLRSKLYASPNHCSGR